MKNLFLLFSTIIVSTAANAQTDFAQLGTALPTPNSYRTASGAPGHEYYQ